MARRFQFSLKWLVWLTATIAFQAATAARRASVEELRPLERIAFILVAAALVATGLILLCRPFQRARQE
jgi:hypothetical protein